MLSVCKSPLTSLSYDLYSVLYNQGALKTPRPLHSKLKKNSRTFQGENEMEFKDFSRSPPKMEGLFKTVRTLLHACVELKHFDNLYRKQQNCPCLRN